MRTRDAPLCTSGSLIWGLRCAFLCLSVSPACILRVAWFVPCDSLIVSLGISIFGLTAEISVWLNVRLPFVYVFWFLFLCFVFSPRYFLCGLLLKKRCLFLTGLRICDLILQFISLVIIISFYGDGGSSIFYLQYYIKLNMKLCFMYRHCST